MLFKHVEVIVNPAAGQGHPILRTLNTAFRPVGIDWEIAITKEDGDAYRLARQARSAGADLVVACGGDGLVGEVANALVGSDMPMAILPAGTMNVMSVDLGIPSDITAACQVIANEDSVIRAIDMGQMGDRFFLLRVSTGFEAERVKGATRELKDRFGPLAYIISALQQRPVAAHYSLTLDGERVERDGLTCVIANSGNVGLPGISLFEGIDVSDGLLDVIFVHTFDLARLFAFGEQADSRESNARLVERWQVRDVTVVTDPPQAVQGDGEVWGEIAITAHVLPQAVRVVVPAPAPKLLSGPA